MPITSKSSKFKGVTQPYVEKLPKSAGARHYCPKIRQVPGTPGTRAKSSPVYDFMCKKNEKGKGKRTTIITFYAVKKKLL